MTDTVREQFNREAEMLLGLIRGMIEGGQLDEAAMLLDQYSQLNPADKRAAELRAEIAAIKNSAEPEKNKTKKSTAEPTKNNNLPDILTNTESVFIVAGLITKRSGFYTSIFNKIRIMEERLGYCSAILTYRHDIDLRKTEVWLKTFTGSSEVMSPGTKILNIYEHFQGSYAPELENKAIYTRTGPEAASAYIFDNTAAGTIPAPESKIPPDTDLSKYTYTKESESCYTLNYENQCLRRDVYNGYMGCLRTEQYYSGGKHTHDAIYDDWGYLNCIRKYDKNNAQKYKVKYFKTSGEACIEAEFDTDIDILDPQKITLINADRNGSIKLKDNRELAGLYLTQLMRANTDENDADSNVTDENNADSSNAIRKYLLVFETGLAAKIADYLDETKTNNFAKVSVIHSIFLKNAYRPVSGPQLFYEYICKKPSMMDGIVFLTEAAKDDFAAIFGERERGFVIPHPYPHPIEKIPFDERESKKIVIVSRFFPEKQIDISIDIFCEVVKAVPEARLEIYGIGPEQEAIEAYIKKRGMQSKISVMGYTDDAVSVYRTAVMHMMTGTAEGYGLTLMESICNGCPAFSFDIKYGPADIIKDGETGFLFSRDDKAGFAGKMIEYLTDTSLQRRMSGNCYNDAERFSVDNFLSRWLDMVGRLMR